MNVSHRSVSVYYSFPRFRFGCCKLLGRLSIGSNAQGCLEGIIATLDRRFRITTLRLFSLKSGSMGQDGLLLLVWVHQR